MSGLCGWFAPADVAIADDGAIATMSSSLVRHAGGTAHHAALACGAAAVAGAKGETHLCRLDRTLVAIWGRPRFSDAELAGFAQHHGIARALAEGHARKGTDAIALLSGSFAAAIMDAAAGEVVLATDRIGTRPLCYAVDGKRVVFGSTLDAIRAFPGIDRGVDRQAIYDYVYFHMVPGPRTAMNGVTRLLPGTFLRWRAGKAETLPYWEMRYVEDEARSFAELKEQFLATLRDSVRRAAADGTVGTFLSGGTDSSTLAGLLGEVTGEPARTYSIGFEAQGYDEMEYARIAARHFGTRHHEYYVTPADVASAIPRIADVHDQPFGNSSAVPTYYCARLAKGDGIDALLGGDGGDELFGGNVRYAKQRLYSLYSDLPALVRKGLIEPLVFLPPEAGIAGKIQRYIRNASVPMPARYDNYNLLERLGPETVFTGDFLAEVDRASPPAQMAQAYHGAHAQSLVNRMLALDLRYTLADNDLPKVARSCELAGVEVRYPLLDDAVVAFSARLAPRLKLKGTRLRWFFKEALRGFLPDQIITKSKHGFGLPFGPWLETHAPLRQLALDSLASLKRRHIVRPAFIDELTSVHVRSHADYYGTMVWVLMMLEQWFRRPATAAHASRAEPRG
jgi:asparagine synthase (glutamine-hydrolysing)